MEGGQKGNGGGTITSDGRSNVFSHPEEASLAVHVAWQTFRGPRSQRGSNLGVQGFVRCH